MRKRFFMISLFVLFPAAAWAASTSASGHNVMLTGEILRSATGDYLVSSNNAYVLIMQKDGNFCEYHGSSATNFTPGAIWCSNTAGSGGKFSVQLHWTNNFCVTTGDEWGQGAALWCTNQVGPGAGPAYALLKDDGSFYIATGTTSDPGVALWPPDFSKVALSAPVNGTIQWAAGTCPPACGQIFRVASTVNINAVPASGFFLKSWSGSCTSANPGTSAGASVSWTVQGSGYKAPGPCALSVAAGNAQNVGATFTSTPPSASSYTMDMGDGPISVRTVEGLERLIEVFQTNGAHQPGVLKVTRDFTATKEFLIWRQAVIDGCIHGGCYKTIVITGYDAAGAVLARYTLMNAYAMKYFGPSLNARNSANASESIEFTVDSMTVSK